MTMHQTLLLRAGSTAGELKKGGAAVASGELVPRHFEFEQISETPEGYSTWLVTFGTQLTGGLDGITEDIEYEILKPDGSGTISGTGTFEGTLDGKRGGFIFESTGVQNGDGTFVTRFTVVRESAYGELAGLRGRGQVIASRDHCGPDDTPETCTTIVTYEFRYRLPTAVGHAIPRRSG